MQRATTDIRYGRWKWRVCARSRVQPAVISPDSRDNWGKPNRSFSRCEKKAIESETPLRIRRLTSQREFILLPVHGAGTVSLALHLRTHLCEIGAP